MSHRGNQFNLIRLMAAVSVLYSHSFALSSGSGRSEPLYGLLGMSLGTLAVSVFFVVSGYLVTASLRSRQGITDFLLARARRIYPALWVALGLTVLLLGPLATNSSLWDYLADPRTRFYLAKNATLVFGFADGLPGVFEGLPLPRAVNGSLWTLPLEIRLYLTLALMLAALRLCVGDRSDRWLRVLIAVVALSLFVRLCLQGLTASPETRLATLFFGGAILQVWQPHVRLSAAGFACVVGISIAAAQAGAQAFLIVFTVAASYGVVYVALAPCRWLQRCSPTNDYSYGLYIYGFPVQQAILSLSPGLDAPSLFVASAAVALPLAALSWHFVESSCIASPTPPLGQRAAFLHPHRAPDSGASPGLRT